MTHCPNCLRHSIADTIPAHKHAEAWIPAFIVCGYCGWCIREVEAGECA